jgi:hypothetical protein
VIFAVLIPLEVTSTGIWQFGYKSLECKPRNDNRMLNCKEGIKPRDNWGYIFGYYPSAYIELPCIIVSFVLIWWYAIDHFKNILRKYDSFLTKTETEQIRHGMLSIRLFSGAMIIITSLRIVTLGLKDHIDQDASAKDLRDTYFIFMLASEYSQTLMEFSIFVSISKYLKVSKEQEQLDTRFS